MQWTEREREREHILTEREREKACTEWLSTNWMSKACSGQRREIWRQHTNIENERERERAPDGLESQL